MCENHEDRVRELAYFKWKEAGEPHGRDKEFWAEAEQELCKPVCADQGLIFWSVVAFLLVILLFVLLLFKSP